MSEIFKAGNSALAGYWIELRPLSPDQFPHWFPEANRAADYNSPGSILHLPE